MPTVLAHAVVTEHATRHGGQTERVVKFAIGEQTSVRRDPRAVEFKLQTSVIGLRCGLIV